MKMSNETFDRIKWFALVFIPAFEVLILTLGKIWGVPYYSEIGASVAAIGVFLAALIRTSSNAYYNEIGAAVAIESGEDADPGEEVR